MIRNVTEIIRNVKEMKIDVKEIKGYDKKRYVGLSIEITKSKWRYQGEVLRWWMWPLIFLPGENLFLITKIDLHNNQFNQIFLSQSPLILFQSTWHSISCRLKTEYSSLHIGCTEPVNRMIQNFKLGFDFHF